MKDSYRKEKIDQLYWSLKKINLNSFEKKLSYLQQFILIGKGVPSEDNQNNMDYSKTINSFKKAPNQVEYTKIVDAIIDLPAEDVLDCVTKISQYGAANQALLDKFREDIFSNYKVHKPNTVVNILITDCERYGSGLLRFIKSFDNECNINFKFTLATDNHLVNHIFDNALKIYSKNIKVQYMDFRSLGDTYDAALITDFYIRKLWARF